MNDQPKPRLGTRLLARSLRNSIQVSQRAFPWIAQLVGQELRAFENLHGPSCRHFVILDGKESWAARRADLRRAVDLFSMGLIDELVVDREILEEWPRIIRECASR